MTTSGAKNIKIFLFLFLTFYLYPLPYSFAQVHLQTSHNTSEEQKLSPENGQTLLLFLDNIVREWPQSP